MCGRTACALSRDVICRACSYYDKETSKHKTPAWKEHPQNSKQLDEDGLPTNNHRYFPDANITPTKHTPILFKDSKSGEYVVQPMMWGLIPPWHKGDPKAHKLSTNNCRLEGLPDSKLYRRSLIHRNVCVILAQGFYEWRTVGVDQKAAKQPYFIYMPQSQDNFKLKISDESIWNNSGWNEEEGWKGPNILKIAGLYDVWTSAESEPVYSYTMITMESNKTLSWLHDRMPAVLETPEDVEAWLNVSGDTKVEDLIKILKPATKLEWYTVSSKVNNSRCHDMDCHKPAEMKATKGNSIMLNWLKKGQQPSAATTPSVVKDEPSEKKPKVEGD